MKNEELKNDIKDVVEFKSRYQLIPEEIKELPKVTTIFEKIENKKKNTIRINLKFILPCEKEEILITYGNIISDVKYQLFKEDYKCVSYQDSFTKSVPLRLVKGQGKNGHIYYLWELFLGSQRFYQFFSNEEVSLMVRRKPKIKFQLNDNLGKIEEEVNTYNPFESDGSDL